MLPDGAACAQAKPNTVSEQVDVGVEFGGDIEEIITVGASFTQSSETSSTETLTTNSKIDCKDGSKAGYVV